MGTVFFVKSLANTCPLLQTQGSPSQWVHKYLCFENKPWLVGRKGSAQFHAVPVAQISHLVSLEKLTYAVAMDGVRYLVEQTLSELEAELDPARFFRINRQLLVAARAVRHYSPAGKGRLKVSIGSGAADEAFVSQERAADFKAWLQAAPIAG